MLETAYLKYRFGFFPLALFFPLQSFLSFALFAPPPKYSIILQLFSAMLLSNTATTRTDEGWGNEESTFN